MKNLVKNLSIGIIGLSLCGVLSPTSLNESVYAMEETIDKNEMRIWEESVLENVDSETPIGDWKTMERSAYGGWTWRDGVICITDSYAKSPLFNNGHAGIVAAAPYYEATIEANPEPGVQVVYGNWADRFSGGKVYQIGVTKTSIEADQKVAYWAARQIGKPYNHEFFNINTRSKFYCSQLVWAGYKDVTGVDIGTWAWGSAIHPFELLSSGETTLIYRNK